jgi:hypothetical protein
MMDRFSASRISVHEALRAASVEQDGDVVGGEFLVGLFAGAGSDGG